jgi:hypothetical protein
VVKEEADHSGGPFCIMIALNCTEVAVPTINLKSHPKAEANDPKPPAIDLATFEDTSYASAKATIKKVLEGREKHPDNKLPNIQITISPTPRQLQALLLLMPNAFSGEVI